MAMQTTLIGLMALGFLMLFMGLPWWMGVGIIILALAFSLGGSEPQRIVQTQPALIMKGPKKEKEPTGSVNDPFHFRPTIPPDGIAAIGSISTPGEERLPGEAGNLAVGKRTGTMSFYVDNPDVDLPMDQRARVRIKDDLRVNLPFMDIEDENGIKPFTNLFTSHFRTGNPIIKTKCLEPTFETWKTGFDEWAKE
jgi:hypothetical protein